MKESARRVWMRIYYGVLVVCGLGLVLAVLGLFLQREPLYYTGLLMAALLFVIVLPTCVLLLALTIIGGIRELMGWSRGPAGRDDKTDDQPLPPTCGT
jgi:hypothetical protein